MDADAPLLGYDGPFCPWIHGGDDSARPRPWSILQRRLTFWLLVVSFDGAEELVVEGRPWRVEPGGAYLVQPGWLADLRSAGSRPAWLHFDVRFDPRRRAHPYAHPHDDDLAPRRQWLQPGARETWGIDLPVLVPAPLLPRFASDVPWIIRRWRDGGRLAGIDAANRLGGLLLALVEHVEGARAADPLERIARAEALARNSLDTGFGVEAFAAAAGYRRSRFSEVYREVRGTTPTAFLQAERLARAKELLARGDLPIARIAALVGHPDPTVFGRIFRAATGMAPGAWRDGQGAR